MDQQYALKFKPWMIEAENIEVDEEMDGENPVAVNVSYSDTILLKSVCRTSEVDDFLSKDSHYRVLTAGKGLGKTFLLIAKRLLLEMELRNNCLFLPRRNLVSKIHSLSLPGDAYSSVGDRSRGNRLWTEPQNWEHMWVSAIALVIDRALPQQDKHHDLDSHLDPGCQLAKSVASGRKDLNLIVSTFANSSSAFFECTRDSMQGVAREYLQYLNQKVALFIDNVDEGLSGCIESKEGGGADSACNPLPSDIWLAAQQGLVIAIRWIKQTARKIRVYATTREEALRLYQGGIAEQLWSITCKIAYSKEDLRRIFDANVALMPKRALVEPNASDGVMALFGATEVTHPVANEKEAIFNGILRHTFLRPRDLMIIGGKLAGQDKDERRQLDLARAKVNEAADAIFMDGKKGTVAPWIDEYFEIFCFMPYTILTKTEMEKATRQFTEETKKEGISFDETPFEYFYRHGVLGVVRSNATHHDFRIHFEPFTGGEAPQRSTLPKTQRSALPPSLFYCFHPCLKAEISRKNGFITEPGWAKKLIVGHDCIVPDQVRHSVEEMNAGELASIDADLRVAVKEGSSPSVYFNDEDVSKLFEGATAATVTLLAIAVAAQELKGPHHKKHEIPFDEFKHAVEQVKDMKLPENLHGPKDRHDVYEKLLAGLEQPNGLHGLRDLSRKLAKKLPGTKFFSHCPASKTFRSAISVDNFSFTFESASPDIA